MILNRKLKNKYDIIIENILSIFKLKLNKKIIKK